MDASEVIPAMSKSGVKPIPTRWKGFYRALKRNEEWAIKFKGNLKIGSLSFLLKWTYSHPANDDFIKSIINAPNPFLELIKPHKDKTSGGYYPIPVIYGAKDKKRVH